MSSSVKVSGVYKNTAPYVKVGGNWKFSKEAWAKVSGTWKQFFLAGGVPDTAFNTNTGTGVNNIIYSIKIQSDKKIIIVGGFATFNGVTVNQIVRLNTDGTRDTQFTTNTGTAANGPIYDMALQSDGKILLGGNFVTWNGATVNGRFVRLNSNGTRDLGFTSPTSINASIYSLGVQSDGKIIVGGVFTNWGGTAANRIVRLNADGSLDTSFMSNVGTAANSGGSSIDVIAIQPDQKILLGGFFTTWNGTTVNNIVRLNTDGTRDTGFTTNTSSGANYPGANYPVNSIAIQPDGKIVIGGEFTIFNGTAVNSIARLNSDGTSDTAFTNNTGSGASGTVSAIAMQSDGKIVIGGFFTTFNSTTVNRIARLNSDGTRDTGFTTNTGTGASASVNSIAIQSDGKIVIGGAFLSINNAPTYRIARIGGDISG